MNIDANDPRWTAYALGELTDEKERAELEKILSESEEMRLLVEDIRQTASLLNDGLKSESPAALTPNQRDRIETQASKGRSWFWARPVWAMSAAAACLLMIVSVWVYQLRDGETTSTGPESLIADLRSDSAVSSDPSQQDADKTKPSVEIAPTSVTVTADEEKSVKETESVPSAGASRAVKAQSAEGPSVNEAAESLGANTAEPAIPIQAAKTLPVPSIADTIGAVPQTAILQGSVKDTSGANLPGVTIEAENIDSGIATTTLTDNSGVYKFFSLAPGEYELKASLDGFQTRAFTDVYLAEAKPEELDFDMPVAGLSEAIEVTTSAQDILTESSASTGTVLKSQSLVELPMTSDDVMELVNIMGGVQPATGEGDIYDSNKTDQSYAGVDANALNIEKDGITINDARYKTGVVGGVAGGVAGGYVGGFRQRYPSVPPPPGPRPPREEGRIYLPRRPVDFNTEGYENIVDNPFLEVTQNPLSTFSIDVDTASYANVRRFLDQGGLPPRDAVRIEELVNYFDYDYKGPGREGPFAAHFEMTDAPWNTEHRLLRIGLKAKEIKGGERPETNLIFLIDVSGSMAAPNKLLLVQDAMHMLIDRLTENDHVAIVTYAGSTRVALPSTRGNRKWSIHRAVDSLRSGGSTAGASGIQLAYETAQRNFIKGGVNRVILATDGDFNVGITNHGDLARLIEEKASSGVFLSALGFGMGNYKDDTLELLANKGRGNYAYIDTIEEARKVLVEQINATLVGVAKDVKIQVEFNPARVGAYRLIGYEDRIMAKEDFNDDTKKAGVIGAGHAVTALYEIVPAGKPIPSSGVDPLKYQKPVETTRAASSDEAGTVKIRYKEPEGEKSSLMEFAVRDSGREFEKASGDFKFAASVAAFGMVLRDSPYKGSATLERALDWAKEGKGDDPHGYRTEYIRLLHRAMSIKK